METWVRWAGGCWIAAGVLLLVELAHPEALAIGFAESSRQVLWPAVHVAGPLPIAGEIAVVAFAAAQVWLDWALLSCPRSGVPAWFGSADERGGAGGQPSTGERTTR